MSARPSKSHFQFIGEDQQKKIINSFINLYTRFYYPLKSHKVVFFLDIKRVLREYDPTIADKDLNLFITIAISMGYIENLQKYSLSEFKITQLGHSFCFVQAKTPEKFSNTRRSIVTRKEYSLETGLPFFYLKKKEDIFH